MLNINFIHCASRYSYTPTMNGLTTIDFQDNQPIVHDIIIINIFFGSLIYYRIYLPTHGDSDS